MLLSALLVLGALAAVPPAAAVDPPGPDTSAQRYRVVDSANVGVAGATKPTLLSIPTSGGTNQNQGDDTKTACLDIGFTFTYYGREERCVYVHSNGYLTFDDTDVQINPVGELPNGGRSMIAGFFTDLVPGSCGVGTVTTYSTGTAAAGDRRFRVVWQNVYGFTLQPGGLIQGQGLCGSATSSPQSTFSIDLVEKGSVIDVHLFNVRPGKNGNANWPYLVGIQSHNGAHGITYAYDTAGTQITNRAVRFYPNTPPVVTAVPTQSIPEGTGYGYTLAATDADGDEIRGFCIDGTPAIGKLDTKVPACNAQLALSPMPPPALEYLAPSQRCGDDQFKVRALDTVLGDGTKARGGVYGPARTIAVTVLCSPDAPTIDYPNHVTMPEDSVLEVTLTGITSGPGDSDPLLVTASSTATWLLPQVPVAYTNGETKARLTLAPAPDQNGGPVLVTVRVEEAIPNGRVVQRTFQVTVTPEEDDPRAFDASAAGASPIAVQPGVTDPDGDLALTLSVVSPPSQGTVRGNGPFLYLANRFTCGPDSFTYRATDSTGRQSNVAKVTLQVVCPDNFPPSAQNQYHALAYRTQKTFELEAVDYEDQPLSYHLARQPMYGHVTLDGDTATYRPDPDFCGEDAFEFQVHDGQYYALDAGVVTLIVACPKDNAPPLAHSFTIPAMAGDTVPVVLSGTDPENQPLTFAIESPPLRGTLSGSGAEWVYTPKGAFLGIDVIRYRAIAGPDERSPAATVTIVYTEGKRTASGEGFTLAAGGAGFADADLDGVPDGVDNCPRVANEAQKDGDGDGLGDACDGAHGGAPLSARPLPSTPEPKAPAAIAAPDADLDGVPDMEDNCPSVPNARQTDLDRDNFGDACDPDRDGDGVDNLEDLCPEDRSAAVGDFDGDLVGDPCDLDADNDGIADRTPDGGLLDNCQRLANPGQQDLDGDGIGDRCDVDPDGDGLAGVCGPDCQRARARAPAALGAQQRSGTATLGFIGAGFLVVVALVVLALPFLSKPQAPKGPKP